MVTEESVLESIKEIIDPEIGINIVDMDLSTALTSTTRL